MLPINTLTSQILGLTENTQGVTPKFSSIPIVQSPALIQDSVSLTPDALLSSNTLQSKDVYSSNGVLEKSSSLLLNFSGDSQNVLQGFGGFTAAQLSQNSALIHTVVPFSGNTPLQNNAPLPQDNKTGIFSMAGNSPITLNTLLSNAVQETQATTGKIYENYYTSQENITVGNLIDTEA